MAYAITSVLIQQEPDVVAARQRTRQIASALGFDSQDQTRLATAVSELARNAYGYAGGGKIEFMIEGQTTPQVMLIRVSDKGPGIVNLGGDSRRALSFEHRHGPRYHRRAPLGRSVRHSNRPETGHRGRP